VLAPDNAATPQLQLIAQICRMLDERGRAALLACETSDDMSAVLAAAPGQRSGGAANAPAAGRAGKASPLAACLQWQSVALDFAPPDQSQAMTMLVALCARAGAVSGAEEIRAELQRQGEAHVEAVDHAAAFFSMETRHVYRTVVAVGVSAAGVACAGGQVCKVCALVLFPPSSAQEAEKVLAALRLSLSQQNLPKLLAAKSSKEALDCLLAADL
jgi:mannitol/fructose-specific phosphotransferase system IIA component (Ntr-type)